MEDHRLHQQYRPDAANTAAIRYSNTLYPETHSEIIMSIELTRTDHPRGACVN
jgi:hypothetical protein